MVDVHSYCGYYSCAMERSRRRVETQQPNWTVIREESQVSGAHLNLMLLLKLKAKPDEFRTRTFHLLEDLLDKPTQCFRVNLDTNLSPPCLLLKINFKKGKEGRKDWLPK